MYLYMLWVGLKESTKVTISSVQVKAEHPMIVAPFTIGLSLIPQHGQPPLAWVCVSWICASQVLPLVLCWVSLAQLLQLRCVFPLGPPAGAPPTGPLGPKSQLLAGPKSQLIKLALSAI